MSSAEPRYCYRHPDRETGLSCSDCGRPICADCATFAPVGIRCPDHAGTRRTAATRLKPRPVRRAPGIALASGQAPVTRALIAINIAIYLIGASQGAGFNNPGGSLYAKLWLDGPDVHNGGWWRLVTAMFLHASVIHIAFNMLALWIVGPSLEAALGRVRFLALYVVAALGGSLCAYFLDPRFVADAAAG